MMRVAAIVLALCGAGMCSGCADGLQAASAPTVPLREKQIEELVAKHRDMTYQDLADETPQRDYLEKLSFDPATVKFYDEAVELLQLDDAGKEMLRRQGLVSVEGQRGATFGALYYHIYTKDLPVLVTTDSVLHAMHRTYDELLKELESTFFTSALDEALRQTHELIAGTAPRWGTTRQNYRDVDLYLTVARNLLDGAGATQGERRHVSQDLWNGELTVTSQLDQNEEARRILLLVQSLALQTGGGDDVTAIFGSERRIDYSQFKPRGHYVKSAALSRYFRTMMWLGRADTGWNLLPPDPASGIRCDAAREAGDAMLLAQLMNTSGGARRLQQMSDILDFLIGEGDCLTLAQMTELLGRQGLLDAGNLASAGNVARLQRALTGNDLGQQLIASQVIDSNPESLHQSEPPRIFQLFGQRFVVDSFLLSKVVYDSIIFDDKKVLRMMPTGLDVMYALGNDATLPLLKQELEEFPYTANLQACREFVGEYQPELWRRNLYNIWLDALRTVDEDLSAEPHAPEAMRTQAWQRKQLQTQLASWAELRHNTLLYAKQSYSIEASCEYPAGYVEPYPEAYARIKLFANEAARRIGAADYALTNGDHAEVKRRQIEFLKKMADTLGRLETLARKELAAEPFSDEEQQWMKTLIEAKPAGCTGPSYSGWYGDLFYGGGRISAEWDPTVVDIHTDPNTREVLETGVGACNLLAVAIDNEDDRMIYVGPAYSYYEFRHPAEKRLTDMEWAQLLFNREQRPARPSWTASFCPPEAPSAANP